MKLSISFKLLIGLSFLIFGMTASIAYLNSEYLKKTILQRERDFSLSLIEAKAKQVETYFDKQITASTLLAKQLLDQQRLNHANSEKLLTDVTQTIATSEVLRNNTDLFSLEITTLFDATTKALFKKPDWNNTNDLNTDLLKQKFKKDLLQKINQNPTQALIVNSSDVFKVSSTQKKYSTMTLIIPYSTLDKKLNEVLIAHINADPIYKLLTNTKLGTLKLFNDWGYSIASSDSKFLSNVENYSKDFSKTETYSFIKNYPLPNYSGIQVDEINISKKTAKKNILISFSKTQRGLFLLSEIPVATLLAPAELISLTTLRLSGYFLAGSLFLLLLFSSSLTGPLTQLAEISLEVAKGNYDHNASHKLKQFFKDEVYTLSIAVDRMVKGLKERNRYKTLFDKFHGSAVTEDLMKNEIALRGEKKQMFVFFSDLRGFTNMSESKDPTLVVKLLNEYFSYMVPVINQSGGVVDKFIGDAIMAVWGVPHEKPDDGKNALMACLKMRLSLETLNRVRVMRGEPELWMGMALHYGEAISGTIGSLERMEYTVIGNTINTASRIEASTKTFGTDLLVSEEVKNKLQDFIYEEAGTVEVKGRSESLKLYKVLGFMSKNGTKIEVNSMYATYAAEGADKVKMVS